MANKKYVDDSIEDDNILKFNRALQNCVKVSVGNNLYNLTKFYKVQISYKTIIKAPDNGGYLLQYWNIKCNGTKNSDERQIFITSTKISSPTDQLGATSLPPFGDSFMYIGTSSNDYGRNVSYSFQWTDISHISIITFYNKTFSAGKKIQWVDLEFKFH